MWIRLITWQTLAQNLKLGTEKLMIILSSLQDISFASRIAFFRCVFAMVDLFKVFCRDFVAVVEFRVLIYVFFNSNLSHHLFIFYTACQRDQQ